MYVFRKNSHFTHTCPTILQDVLPLTKSIITLTTKVRGSGFWTWSLNLSWIGRGWVGQRKFLNLLKCEFKINDNLCVSMSHAVTQQLLCSEGLSATKLGT